MDTRQVNYNRIFKHDLREFIDQPIMECCVILGDGHIETRFDIKSIELREYFDEPKNEIIIEQYHKFTEEDELTVTIIYEYDGDNRINCRPEKILISEYGSEIWYNIPEYEEKIREVSMKGG